MSGYQKYSEAIRQVSRDYLKTLDLESNEEFKTIFHNTLFGEPGPRRTQREGTNDEKRLGKLFRGWVEIAQCRERLSHSEVYVRQYPHCRGFKARKITKVTYMRYHVEKYLEEMYILKTRLVGYLGIVRKLYRGNLSVNKVLTSLSKSVKVTLDPIVNVRGSHIHHRRYEDPDIDQLELHELLAAGMNDLEKDGKELKLVFESIYRKKRDEWAKRIRTNNKAIDRLLDAYFDALYPLAFPVNS